MRKRMIKFGIIAVMLVCVMTGCGVASEETVYTKEAKEQISDMHGFPNVSNFFEYSQLKEIYELRDNPNLICHWYTKNDMSGKWVYQGKCVGYGIPYGASITAPESAQKILNVGWEIIPLAEPNGLYNNGVTSSATWILSTDENGDITPTYVESEITVSQNKIDEKLCEEWSIPEGY